MIIQHRLKIKFFKLLLILFWGFISVSLLSISLPNNVLTPSYKKNRYNVFVFFPQGWGFFTRNPRLPVDIYLLKAHNKWIADPRLRYGTLYNIFGLDRKGRVVSSIYQKIHLSVLKSHWYVCKDYELEGTGFKTDTFHSVSIKYKKVPGVPMPEDLIIVNKPITPWAYRKIRRDYL